MQIKRKHRASAEVPTHSLNDIMFFLLLFFLIMAVFSNPNVLKLLTAKSGIVDKNKDKTEKKTYDLQVTVDKEFYYNGTKMSDEELLKTLTAEAQADSLMLVAIDIHQDVDIQKLVDVVSVCKKSNAKYYLKDPRAN
jgi:biopolymer transport protein ExbD